MQKAAFIRMYHAGIRTGAVDRTLPGFRFFMYLRRNSACDPRFWQHAKKITDINLSIGEYALIATHTRSDSMELQFRGSSCRCLMPAVREVRSTEMTQEVRLSDGMPDIGRVIASWGQIILMKLL